MTTTAAITVAWRNQEDTLGALRSLAEMSPAADHVICVVQEFSAAETAQFKARLPVGVELIEVTNNLGFSAAANLAMGRAADLHATYALVLNNDATVTRDCLGRCLEEAAADPRIAVVGPAIAFTDNPTLLWYGGGKHSHRFAYTRHRGLNRAASRPLESTDTEYIPGCCALFFMNAWKEVGGFREDFFMYYEDADWGARARAAGWRLRYLGEVLCWHTVGVSSRQRGSLVLGENTAYYLGRNPLRYALDTPFLPLRLSRVVGLMTVWNAYNAWRIAQSRRLAVARSYIHGLRDGAAGRMGPRPT